MRNAKFIAAAISGALLLSACGNTPKSGGYFPDQRLQYKKQREAPENLEVPPDLITGGFDDAMDVPPLGEATYSKYAGGQSSQHRTAGSGEVKVLPQVEDVRLRREGNDRWLEIHASPQQVWPKVVGFWRSQGVLLVEQDPATGIMKTDWLENRAEISRDFITSALRKVIGRLYSTGLRDQYRVRIEPGMKAGTTDLYLTHRAMEEHLRTNVAGEATSPIWAPAPADADKEAVMLRRLMLFLGASEHQASVPITPQAQAIPEAESRLTRDPDGKSLLIIEDEYRRAWRLTGLALDRVGFAVEDRDRTQGIYYVRYDDPSKADEKKGWISKLAFWRRKEDKDLKGAAQYQVKLLDKGARTHVVVHDRLGGPELSATADRILQLLHEQIQ